MMKWGRLTKEEKAADQAWLNDHDDGHEGDFGKGCAAAVLIIAAAVAVVIIFLAMHRVQP